ncbi:MAG: DNA primase [Candidatus Cohnella colombiensis]|uniref:DNA primase n=1 Tax=Candidatus Cohnella colombiensis TaxID=3121368 RepID=A0AA95EW55_9BACL|nr:MAG: DNA primase [Cohnella sp.]
MNYGSIPQTVIDEVLRRHDIAETVGKVVHLVKNGKYLKGLCPFHSEKTPSFTVTPEKQIFHCYGCGKGGNAIKFVMEMEAISFPEAVKMLAIEADIPVTWSTAGHEEPSPRQREKITLVEAHEYSAKLYHYILRNTEPGKPAMEYLRTRGFTDTLIEEFAIGYAPSRWDTLTGALERKGYEAAEMELGGLLSKRQEGEGYVDRFRDRIIFPIQDGNGQVIAFGGRIMSDGQPKYLNSPETPLFNKSRTFYRLHAAKATIRRTRQAVLFEGYVDVIKAWSAGVHNGLATMGTALTSEHATQLKRFAEEVVLCYDGDDAGQAAAIKSIPILESVGLIVRVCELPNRMDPDEYITAKGPSTFMREVIEAAVSTVKFQLIYLRKSHILLEEDGRIRYLREAVKLVARRDSPTERELLLKELAQEFGVSLDTLKQESVEIRQQEKLGNIGDIPASSWNNVWNDKRSSPKLPTLTPAYIKAERHLLLWMMLDADTSTIVQSRIGAHFNVEDHAAIAAYLYSYYAQGQSPDVGRFTAFLQDDRLERTASSIALEDFPFDERVLEGYFRTIEDATFMREIDRMNEEMQRLLKLGEHLQAAQIAQEMSTLKQQRKK